MMACECRHPTISQEFAALKSKLILTTSYKVTSWSIVRDPTTKQLVYDIAFKRLATESSIDTVFQRPWTEEVEDYGRYKRLKRGARERRLEAARLASQSHPGVVVTASDGTTDDPWAVRADSVGSVVVLSQVHHGG